MSFGDYVKAKANALKSKIKSAIMERLKPILLPVILVILLIAIAILAVFGIKDMDANASEQVSGMIPATGTSWEQFMRYVISKEGGGNDGEYYYVEDDGYGVPTIGHGLALFSDGHGHKAEFAAFNIDTTSLVKAYYNGDKTNSKVSVEICDEIFSNHMKGIYDSVVSSVGSYNLKEYQYYALTDVKYRRGNIGSSKVTSGFTTDYTNLWSDSENNSYGNYNEANETFNDTGTLYHFFWDGGHSLPGVRTRKHDQWVLFKYGYYRPLKEYWTPGGQELSSDTEGIKGYYTSSSGKTYIEYSQNISSSSWYSKDGCFHCSIATIISGWGATKTPNQLSGFSYGSGCYGNRGDIGTYGKCKWGTITSNKKENLKKYLSAGNPAMIHVEGNTLTTDNGSHYQRGHWCAVLDYKVENGKERIYIHNPWDGDPSYGWADLDKVANVISEFIYTE